MLLDLTHGGRQRITQDIGREIAFRLAEDGYTVAIAVCDDGICKPAERIGTAKLLLNVETDVTTAI